MSKKHEEKTNSLRGETWIRLHSRPRAKENTTHQETKKEKHKDTSFRLIVFFLLVCSGWIFFETYHVSFYPFSISRQAENDSSYTKKNTASSAPLIPDRRLFPEVKTNMKPLPLPGELRVMRLATWNLAPLDFDKITDPRRGPFIADMLSRFDIIAIQGVRSRNRVVLDGMVYLLRDRNLRYACLCASWNERTAAGDGLAFLFNMDSIETDGNTLCEITLPNWGNSPAPLVAAFRTIQTEKDKAFTFNLINIQLEKNSPAKQRDMLRDVYEHVRKTSGRRGVPEDDIIILGTFGAPPNNMGRLALVPRLVAVHSDLATELNGQCSDNIVFDIRATSEYVERFGVVDLKSTFELSEGNEAGIATHRAVWADFSVYETANRE